MDALCVTDLPAENGRWSDISVYITAIVIACPRNKPSVFTTLDSRGIDRESRPLLGRAGARNHDLGQSTELLVSNLIAALVKFSSITRSRRDDEEVRSKC